MLGRLIFAPDLASFLDTAEFYVFTCGLVALVAVGAVAARRPLVPGQREKGGKLASDQNIDPQSST